MAFTIDMGPRTVHAELKPEGNKSVAWVASAQQEQDCPDHHMADGH
jgi:hypothetical protein